MFSYLKPLHLVWNPDSLISMVYKTSWKTLLNLFAIHNLL